MLLKKHLIVIVLAVFCLAAALFAVMPINSQGAGEYDPWLDVNDDGSIEMRDISSVARAYGTMGTAINKTELLLQLQTRISSLEARVDLVEALLASAHVYNVTHDTGVVTTTSTDFVDVQGMSVEISVTQPSLLLIIFSTQATVTVDDSPVYMRAMVGRIQAHPDSDYIFITESTYWSAHSCTFYRSVFTGTHTVEIQWRVFTGTTTGRLDERTLTVIALPT